MKNKKTLMMIILVFALVLIGASVLYSQLGKELAPDQLSVQSPQGAAISETKESEDNGDSSESQGADKKTERKETSTEEKAFETEEQKENPVSEAEDGEVTQEETEKPETEKAEREEAKEKRVEAGQTEADKAEERSTETGQTEAEKAEERSTETGQTKGQKDSAGKHETEAEPESKISAPDFTVYTKAGEEVKLSDYFGKPIVLNFWASWCGPCQMEMPDFNEKYLELEDEVNFLMVNMTGGRETVEGAAEFVEEKGYEFPVFYDTDMDAAATYGAYSLPTTYFIDQEGYVIAQAKGAIDGETLQRGLDLIAE